MGFIEIKKKEWFDLLISLAINHISNIESSGKYCKVMDISITLKSGISFCILKILQKVFL